MYIPFQLCQIRDFSPQSILSLLPSFQGQEATDPQDKIYGLLGIISELEKYLIVLDYYLSTKEVYVYASYSIIQATSTLDILSLVDINEPSEDFPSWLYDLRWTDAEHVQLFMVDLEWRSYSASRNSTPSIGTLRHLDRLDVDGFVWDEIIQLGDRYNDIDHTVANPYITLLSKWKTLLREVQPIEGDYVRGGTKENAFWRILILAWTTLDEQHKRMSLSFE